MKNFYAEYQANPSDKAFFHKGFEKWPGNDVFKQQIIDDVPATEIYNSWQEETNAFREIRKRYLKYQDF